MPEPITMIGMGSGVVALATHLARRYFESAKEILDVVLGVVALIVTLPLLGVCAAIIKLSGKGPVLFTQIRVGKDGRAFKMYKLRTMRIDAEDDRDDKRQRRRKRRRRAALFRHRVRCPRHLESGRPIRRSRFTGTPP